MSVSSSRIAASLAVSLLLLGGCFEGGEISDDTGSPADVSDTQSNAPGDGESQPDGTDADAPDTTVADAGDTKTSSDAGDTSSTTGMDGSDGGEGPEPWTSLIGTSNFDDAKGIAIAPSGSLYLAGNTSGDLGGNFNEGGNDAYVAKYNPDGTQDWLQLFGSSKTDIAHGVATDSAGDVYVAGFTRGDLPTLTNQGENDGFLAKFDKRGKRQWIAEIATSGYEEVHGIAIDGSDNIYLAGVAGTNLGGQSNNGGNDAFLAKYDNGGKQQWVRLLGTAERDSASAVAVDADAQVYIGGLTTGDLDGQNSQANGTDIHGFVAQYSPDGTREWVELLGTAAENRVEGLATHESSSLFVTGSTEGEIGGENHSGDKDAFVMRYEADGARDWTRLVGTTSSDEGFGLTTDGAGSVYVGGVTEGSVGEQANSGGEDAFLAKFKSGGQQAWLRQLGTPASDDVKGLVTDDHGFKYAGGQTSGNLAGETNIGSADGFIRRLR